MDDDTHCVQHSERHGVGITVGQCVCHRVAVGQCVCHRVAVGERDNHRVTVAQCVGHSIQHHDGVTNGVQLKERDGNHVMDGVYLRHTHYHGICHCHPHCDCHVDAVAHAVVHTVTVSHAFHLAHPHLSAISGRNGVTDADAVGCRARFRGLGCGPGAGRAYHVPGHQLDDGAAGAHLPRLHCRGAELCAAAGRAVVRGGCHGQRGAVRPV